MPFVTTHSSPPVQLYFEDHGSGQPVVLVHGWPLSHRMWENQVTALVEAGFRCIAYDRRGFGESDRPSVGYDYDTFANDLHDVITTLDLQDVILAGFSMGGGEVARYLGSHGSDRIAKAMFISSVTPFMLGTPDNPTGADLSLFEGMMAGVKQDRVAFLAAFFPNFFNYTGQADFPADAIAYAKSIAWRASPVGTLECIRAFGTTDFRADLAQITVPVLVIHGTSDAIVPFEISGELTAAAIPGSQLVMIEGGSHGLPVTHPEQLTTAMVRFAKES